MGKIIMTRRKLFLAFIPGVLSSLLFLPSPLSANKTSTGIEAPPEVKRGSRIKIKIKAMHSSWFFWHHTDWIVVKINGEVVKRWDFPDKQKDDDMIIREIEYTVYDNTSIEAESHCNLHGSAGKKTLKISVN